MVCWVTELLAGDRTCLNHTPKTKFPQKADESPQKVDPQVLKKLLEEYKELLSRRTPTRQRSIGIDPPSRGN